MRQDYAELQEKNIAVLVIGPEPAEKFCEYWQKEKLPFQGLPDPQGRVLKLLGQEINLFKLGRMPAQLLIDQDGMVRFVHYGKSMSDIPETSELIAFLSEQAGQPLVQEMQGGSAAKK